MRQQRSDDTELAKKLELENEWLAFLKGKTDKKEPYLKQVGRLQKRPNYVMVSAQQRRLTHGE